MRRLLILFACLAGAMSCDQAGPALPKPDFVVRYLSLIKEVKNKYFGSIEEADRKYREYINLPSSIKKLQIRFGRIASIEYAGSGLPSPGYPSWPKILDFMPMRFVYKNGDIVLAANILDKALDNKVFIASEKKIITIDRYKKYFNDYSRILIDGEWYEIKYDPAKNIFYYEGTTRKVIEDFEKMPELFKQGLLNGLITNENAIITQGISIEYSENSASWDSCILYYNWITKSVKRIICFPAISGYRDLNIGISDTYNVDLKNRTYYAYYGKSQMQADDLALINSQKIPGGHIMIYDPEKDTLYNVRHPFWDEENKNEKLLAYQYVLGEDENIYYQLVTDKAYYIYKLELLWDQPMEDDEYKPYFFEFHPELKEAFDKAVVGASK